MTDTAPFGESDLHALADGQLDPARREAIEAWLASRPEEAARVAFYKRVNGELHRLFDPMLDSPIPETMSERPARRWPGYLARAGIAASLLAIGVAGGWTAHQTWQPEKIVEVAAPAPALPQQAALAHGVYSVEVRHPVEVGADDATHLVTWLSRRMGHQLKVPNLDTMGYQFMGGRLLPSRTGGVASQLMYENPAGTRITLYVRPVDGEPAGTSLRFATEDRISVFYWVDSQLGYALAGALSRQDLYKLTHAVYEQISN